jgi:CubicO group peptidase (beta-lactamase class C family)
MFPDTAAAGVWSSSSDLLKLGLDLLNGYNKDKSKILSQSTIKIIINPIINLQENFGWSMGMMVGKINNNLHFGHGGSSSLYENSFVIFPKLNKIVIILCHHNPKYYPGNLISDSKLWDLVYNKIKIKHPYY